MGQLTETCLVVVGSRKPKKQMRVVGTRQRCSWRVRVQSAGSGRVRGVDGVPQPLNGAPPGYCSPEGRGRPLPIRRLGDSQGRLGRWHPVARQLQTHPLADSP